MHCVKSVKPYPCFMPWKFSEHLPAHSHTLLRSISGGPGSTGGAPGHPESNLILHTALQVWYQPTGKKQEWHVFDERCSLQPLASQLLSSTYQSTGLRVPILFIGDSTDRLIQQDVCDLGNMVGARVDPIGYLPDQTTLQVGSGIRASCK